MRLSPTLPVALALGEALRTSGREIVTACAKVYEMQGRVLLASSHDRGSLAVPHARRRRGDGARLLWRSLCSGLDAKQLANALGIAAVALRRSFRQHRFDGEVHPLR